MTKRTFTDAEVFRAKSHAWFDRRYFEPVRDEAAWAEFIAWVDENMPSLVAAFLARRSRPRG